MGRHGALVQLVPMLTAVELLDTSHTMLYHVYGSLSYTCLHIHINTFRHISYLQVVAIF